MSKLSRQLQKLLYSIGIVCISAGCTSLPLAPDEENRLNTEASEICVGRTGSTQKLPERPFRTDGCTLWPDGHWQACCIKHDMVYWCGGKDASRVQADEELRACVQNSGHPFTGSLMWLGTRSAGSRILPTPWRWGYGWKWLQEMQRQGSSKDSNF